MKHNSAIKQVLREFNTKEALKETEIDSAVKEAIGEDTQTAVVQQFGLGINLSQCPPPHSKGPGCGGRAHGYPPR